MADSTQYAINRL